MDPLILIGGAALADFRRTALEATLRAAAPELPLDHLSASFVYLIERKGELSSDVLEKAYALLSTDRPLTAGGEHGFFVIPRKGTISPWSSKATDIFHNCGLSTIHRVERGIYFEVFDGANQGIVPDQLTSLFGLLHDRMTEGVYRDITDVFRDPEPAPMRVVDVKAGGREALARANEEMGLALSDEEIDYLYAAYHGIGRNPTDVELVMFGQVNSEHCRHKIFNADWKIDGAAQSTSLFQMIRNTHALHPEGTLIAYKDNSGVVEGFEVPWFESRVQGGHVYGYDTTQMDMIMKVETHNHPTAISPYPGAATGAGGEIRDEAATGIGGKSKAGLCGFMVSDLKVPGFSMPWEKDYAAFPERLATPLEIMMEGPIGGARFGNEFGRPQLLGLFRTYEERFVNRYRGYHKPIMIAGGMGNIKRAHVEKHAIPPGSLILQLGGPAMRIGLGGGAASSMATGTNDAELDFDSVQRDNAEMERRCQQVIEACISLGDRNPILSIHDIGAGGLSNGCPELVAETGGVFTLRSIHNEDLSMSPMEIWCCEAQERYVLAVASESRDDFLEMCRRERCPVAVVGQATGDGRLVLEDSHFETKPIDIDLNVILGKPPKMVRDVAHVHEVYPELMLTDVSVVDAVSRVLRLPAVSNKTFLITIADRSVTGMVTRDQMVGAYQVPVSDAAVTVTSYTATTGEAMAMGERTPTALISGPASGRMAIGEAVTNLMGVNIGALGNVKLSANWMCACGEAGEDASLFDTVKAVGMELCPELGICIPVGKDSLSMRTLWETEGGTAEKITAPLSLIVTSFAPVQDVRKTVTPDLKRVPSRLLLLDLGGGNQRLGGSALAQVYNQVGSVCPDVDDAAQLQSLFSAMQDLVGQGLLLACHDRSDGGVLTTLVEMAIAGRVGVDVDVDASGGDVLAALFNEELGVVVQVADERLDAVTALLAGHGLEGRVRDLGSVTLEGVPTVVLRASGEDVYTERVSALNAMWSELTYRMQARRDNPDCAEQEYEALQDESDPGIQFEMTFDPEAAPAVVSSGGRPRTAILREQGVNGHVEMAAAFDRAGFESVDVHMTDLLGGHVDLAAFVGLVACGGFSYGDVLGAGSGWARSVLFNERLQAMFADFFSRPETFSLGVCNGCQMLSQLKGLIPGADAWPLFLRNRSEQFEARVVTVELLPSPSIFFRGMEGSRLAIPVAHGEGRACFDETGSLDALQKATLVSGRYVDNRGEPAERYPLNPNGSPGGVTAFTSADGRATIMMPHPERVFRSLQLSYRPDGLFSGEAGPWLRMFQNAYSFATS